MTQHASVHDQTNRPDLQHNTKPNYHHENAAQINYQHPLKINNSNTHLGITIRWVPRPAPELILTVGSVEAREVGGGC